MDIITINLKVLPRLKTILFPDLLIGRLVWHYKDDNGFITRLKEYNVQDEIININPYEQYNEAKRFFELSYFTNKQLEHIFKSLDKYFEIFSKRSGESYFSDSKIEFNQVEKDIKIKIEMICKNYKKLKSELLKVRVSNNLKVNQIAIIYVYERLVITRVDAGEIAAKNGYTSKDSGEGLFQDYVKYRNRTDRIGNPGTKQKMKNKIKLFESIIENLTDKAKQTAIDEIKILNTIFENEYL